MLAKREGVHKGEVYINAYINGKKKHGSTLYSKGLQKSIDQAKLHTKLHILREMHLKMFMIFLKDFKNPQTNAGMCQTEFKIEKNDRQKAK